MTIDERAKAYMHNEITQPQRLAMYEAYKDGAYDQREIDIEKACEWLADILEDVPERDWAEDKIVELRKAMEE